MMRTSQVEFIRNVELSSAAVQRNQVVFQSVTYPLCPEIVLKNIYVRQKINIFVQFYNFNKQYIIYFETRHHRDGDYFVK